MKNYTIGLITGAMVYGFNDGYQSAETIEPRKGYWLRSNDEGAIILTASIR
jgi:hypothetical protein